MSSIKVIRDGDQHWWEHRWNAAVEYKGEKYVICVEETPKWGERNLYHYADCERLNIGEPVCDDDINDNVLERLFECVSDESEFTKGDVFFEDDDFEEEEDEEEESPK